MLYEPSSIRVAFAVTVAFGVLLGHLVASRTAHRPWCLYLVLWIVCMLPRLAVILLRRGAGAETAIVAGLPAIIICVAEGLGTRRARLNAARALGASEWRVFWGIFLPEGLLWIAAGVLLAWGRWMLDMTVGSAL